MLQIPKGHTTEAERAILRHLRVWIAALALGCLVVGVGVGAMLSRTSVIAGEGDQPATPAAIARAPEALSASFAEIARRVEPSVVNIDTVSAAPQAASKEGDEEDEMEVGDWVLAIGSPFGLEQTVTAGIISTKERQTDPGASFRRFIQTDAAINRGNSGGPLVNMRGEVIGINSQIATSTGDYNGIGFALPSNEASFVYKQITSIGKVRRGYLGILLDSVQAEYARVYGLAEAKGVIVTDVRDAQ